MTLEEYKESIESGISVWFDVQIKNAPSTEARQLLERMHALIKRGGKRARPELLYITYAAYGGKRPQDIVDLGMALEFLHQFLLIHDDIMDKDTVRYGGPNIMGVYAEDFPDNSDIAESTALLAGDVLFAYSNQAVVTSKSLSPSQKNKLMEQICRADADVAFGQQLDTYNLDGLAQDFSEDRLVQTHRLKTASYTMKLPMLCASIVLNLPARERRKITEFAEPFGLLFQLADDYSDYFDNDSAFNNRHNRPKHRDYPQGKITYPIFIGLKLADKKQTEIIRRNLGNKTITPAEMDEVVATLDACGAKQASREHLEKFYKKAIDALDALSISATQKQAFKKVLDKYRV